MAEYALILAAVAVVVSVGYQTMGTTITTLLTTVDSSLVEIPYSTEQGILKCYQGISLLDQGIFFE